jgi:ATP-binding cassette subfamily B protein
MSIFASLCARVRGFVQGKVIDKAANLPDITLFDNPDLLNLIKLRKKKVKSSRRIILRIAHF